MAAQVALGGVLTAVALFRPRRPTLATILIVAAIWTAIAAPVQTEFLRGLGAAITPTTFSRTMALAAALASVAALLTRPRWLGAVALVAEALLFFATEHIKDSDGEIAALHVAWFGALLGLFRMASPHEFEVGAPDLGARSHARHDWTLFGLAVVLASIVARYVLQGRFFSADEWAYTYQAAVFAKGHAYGMTPPCFKAFQSFWVFEQDGRMFSQYTPGWPMFMAPFVAVHAVGLAGPVSFGLLVVGVARLGRRAASGMTRQGERAPQREIDAAGSIAAIGTILSSTMLINGGSRFSHVFVCATFAWCIEALCVIAAPLPNRRSEWGWGAFLGSSAALLLATRPVDGGALGIGLFLYFAYAAARRRVAWRSIAGTAFGFAFWGGLTLVVLRLQLGKWFTTGYALTEIVHPWNKLKLSVPKPNELKWAIPLATGSYCWWPLAPALGLGGLTCVRRSEARIAFMLAIGILPLIVAYGLIEYGRGFDFGYGPRYVMPTILPMAVGGGVFLAPLWVAARSRGAHATALARGGPAAIAIAAALLGVVRIAPLVYPHNYADVHNRNTVFEQIKKMDLKNAVVWLEPGTTQSHPLDLTQNYPIELYPNPPALVLIDMSPAERQCIKEHFPERRSYHTSGVSEVTLVPE